MASASPMSTHLRLRSNWLRSPGRPEAKPITETKWPATLSPTCYACGPTSFVEHVAELLTVSGHHPGRIRTERFCPTGDQYRGELTKG